MKQLQKVSTKKLYDSHEISLKLGIKKLLNFYAFWMFSLETTLRADEQWPLVGIADLCNEYFHS